MRTLTRVPLAPVVLLAAISCLGPVRPPGEKQEEAGTSVAGSSETTAAFTTVSADGVGPDSTTQAGDSHESESATSFASTGGNEGQLVDVSHAREFRGTWIATVLNINFPSGPGLSASAQQDELLQILDRVAALGLNAIVLQVRSESDSLYTSDLEPWSRFLTGDQGVAPGYDPLEFAVDEAHARGIEVHAWLNPFRAKVNLDSTAAPNHVSQTLQSYAYPYGTLLWMDPGAEAVRDQVVTVALDLVARYDIDGIHLDDYFYPYPNGGPFPDDLTWQAYLDSGGTLPLDDWRRDNVNQLVFALHDELQLAAPDVRFGIAPFGIYRPGIPPGITGLDQYAELYADPVHWIQQGWVDYLVPQLYWPTTQEQQAYDVLLEWWSSLADGGRLVFAGNAAYKVGTEPAFDAEELALQVDLVRELGTPVQGNIYYNVDTLMEDTLGVATFIADTFYQRPALTPALPRQGPEPIGPPGASVLGDVVELEHARRERLRAFVIYAENEGAYEVERIVGTDTLQVTLPSGRWAISAADRWGAESQGRVVDVP